MMNRFRSWPIRVHLTILIALLAIPSMGLIVYSGMTERREAITGAKTECLKFVYDVAGQQQAMVAGMHQLATALSLLPPVQSRNPTAATTLFSELLRKNPQYANILVCDTSGLVWASAVPLEGKVSLSDRRLFQEAVRTGMFSSGEYAIARISKKPIIGFGYPVRNTANRLIAVLVVTLDLEYSQRSFEKLHLPPGSSFSLLDHKGIILIRYLKDSFSERLVGSRDINQELFVKMTQGPDEGTYETMGNDSNFRLVAYKRISLPHESKPYLYIRSSIPLASATSKANAAMLRNLSLFVSLFLIGLLLAWFMMKRLIVNPLMMLKGASEQLAAGADAVNVSQAVKGGELGALARSFDAMAEALRESEQRWATTLASIGDAVIATDLEGKIAFMNAVAEELTGWTLHDALQTAVTEVFNIINEQTRTQVESPITKVLREGMVVGLANHTILVRKDGAEVPIDDSGAPIKDGSGKTTGVVLVFRDITERRQAEERTRHLASFPQLNPNPIIEAHASGEITFFNPASQNSLEGLGIDKGDIKAFLPEDLDAILRDWDKKHELTLQSEVLIADRVFEETIHLIPQFNVARIYARDITKRKRAEEALKEANERLNLAQTAAGAGVWDWDVVTGDIEWSNQMFDLFGLDPIKAPASFETWRNALHPEDVEMAGLRIDEALKEKTILESDYRVVLPDGQIRWLNATGKGEYDGYGNPIRMIGVCTDITERKQAEEALRKAHDELELCVQERTEELQRTNEELRESEEHYYTLFNAIDEGFCTVEVIFDEKQEPIDYRFLEINAAFEKQTGLIDAQGKRMRELAPKHEAHWFETYGKIALTGQSARFQNHAAQLNRWYDVYAFRVGQPEDRHVAILFNDITEQKRVQEAVRRQADLLELAYNAIFVCDLERRITFWNARAEELYGWTKEEAIGKITHGLLKTQFPVPFDECMAALIKEGHWEGELAHTTKDGQQITVLSRQALQRDEAGNPAAILEINLDVTEARRTEHQLRQSQKMEALGTLTGGIAHDFNNVLAAIIGFAELARDKLKEGSREKRHLQRVFDAGLRGRELVKQMLTFSRKTELDKKPLQLSGIVKETMKLLRASIPTTVSIGTDVRSESGLIFADPTQIQQVVMNLCMNAAHAMQDRGGVLHVELSDFSVSESNENLHGIRPGLYMRLTVRDTGTGISPDIIDRIFDPFFTTKEQGEGTGLGLSVVHGIVKQHAGCITVESEQGKGATFTVYFPKIAEKPKTDAVSEETVPTGSERILFVDDEEALVEMGEAILTDLGYEVLSRTSSREALALFRLDPSLFHLVITDQTMPDLTGIQLAKEITAIRSDIPVILCTGFSHLVDADAARGAGIKTFAMKPLTKREIANTIRKVLGEQVR